MLVGGSVSDCCCLLRRETKHSVWGVLPAPPVPWASNFGYKSRLLAAVFIRRQFCVKCDGRTNSFASGWSSRHGCRELEGLCEKQNSHPGWCGHRCPVLLAHAALAGGPLSGCSSVPWGLCALKPGGQKEVQHFACFTRS